LLNYKIDGICQIFRKQMQWKVGTHPKLFHFTIKLKQNLVLRKAEDKYVFNCSLQSIIFIFYCFLDNCNFRSYLAYLRQYLWSLVICSHIKTIRKAYGLTASLWLAIFGKFHMTDTFLMTSYGFYSYWNRKNLPVFYMTSQVI